MKKCLVFILCLILFGCGSGKENIEIVKDETLYYIVEYKENSVVLYPGMYEKELHDQQSKDFIEMDLDKNIEFYNNETKIVYNDEGKEESKKVKNEKVQESVIKEAVEYDSGFVYIEYSGKSITKMTLYGELIVYE